MCVFAAPFLAPIWVSNVFAGPFITAGLNQQGRAESSDKLYCIRVYVILNLFLLLSTIVSLFLPTNVTKLFFSKLVNWRCFFFFWIKEREVVVANDRNTRKNERRKLREKYIHGLIGFSPNSKLSTQAHQTMTNCHNTKLWKELLHILNSTIIWNNVNLLVEETMQMHCNTLKYENKYSRSFLAKIAEGNYFKNV